ncbi:hypothetical protein ACLI4Z_00140 [Natrialbaceae archaeon A-arb3/5]
MTDHNADVERESITDPPTADGDVSPCYQAYVEKRDGKPNVCTIYSSVSADSVTDQWIAAHGDAFVARDEIR